MTTLRERVRESVRLTLPPKVRNDEQQIVELALVKAGVDPTQAVYSFFDDGVHIGLPNKEELFVPRPVGS